MPLDYWHNRETALPVDIAHNMHGGKVFLTQITGPTTFPEHPHEWIEVAIPFENAAGPVTWHTSIGRRMSGYIHAGHTSVLPSYMPHTGYWETTADVCVLYLTPAFLHETAGDILIGDDVEIRESCTGEDVFLRQLADGIRHQLRSGFISHRVLYLESIAISLELHLLTHYRVAQRPLRRTAEPFSPPQLKAVLDYIHDQIATALSIMEMAHTLSLSPSHFTRLFKNSLGATPYQYVLRCRIATARHLLQTTTLPISTIAHKTGFFDQSHFTHTFRRAMGTTPSAYRHMRQNKG